MMDPPPCSSMYLPAMVSGQEYGIDVDIHILEPLRIGHFVCRRIDADARVGMAEIQPAQLFNDLIHHALNILFLGYIAFDSDYFAAGRFGDFLCRFNRRFIIQVNDGYIRARLCKARCGAFADAPRAAGDKAFFAVQPHSFNDTHYRTSFYIRITICIIRHTNRFAQFIL